MKQRTARLVPLVPDTVFFEDCFKTSGRKIEGYEPHLRTEGLESWNMMRCSPLLTKEQEFMLFRKYNYLKYRIVLIAAGGDTALAKDRAALERRMSRLKDSTLDRLERFISAAVETRNTLIKSNMRLIVRPVGRHADSDSARKEELTSDAYMHLMRAVERFDYRMGIKFSTYCTNTVQNNLRWGFQDEKIMESRFSLGEVRAIERASCGRSAPNHGSYDREFIVRALSSIKNKRNKRVVKAFFGIDCEKRKIKELAAELGVSRYTIQKIKESALERMSKMNYDPVL